MHFAISLKGEKERTHSDGERKIFSKDSLKVFVKGGGGKKPLMSFFLFMVVKRRYNSRILCVYIFPPFFMGEKNSGFV